MIKKIIHWTPDNKKILEDMYNDDKSDVEISAYFGDNVGVYAIEKQRSLLGLTHFKRQKGLKRKQKTIYNVEKNYVVLHSTCKDGHDHYAHLHYNFVNTELLQNITNKILSKNENIRTITVLKPTMIIDRVNVEQIL